LRKQAANNSETLASVYYSTWHNISKDLNSTATRTSVFKQ